MPVEYRYPIRHGSKPLCSSSTNIDLCTSIISQKRSSNDKLLVKMPKADGVDWIFCRSVTSRVIRSLATIPTLFLAVHPAQRDRLITLVTSGKKRNVTVWRLSVCLSVPSAYSPWLTKGQHATRPVYISSRQYIHLYSPNKVAMYINEEINKQTNKKYKQKRTNDVQ